MVTRVYYFLRSRQNQRSTAISFSNLFTATAKSGNQFGVILHCDFHEIGLAVILLAFPTLSSYALGRWLLLRSRCKVFPRPVDSSRCLPLHLHGVWKHRRYAYMGDCRSEFLCLGFLFRPVSRALLSPPAPPRQLVSVILLALLFFAPNSMRRCKCNHATLRVYSPRVPLPLSIRIRCRMAALPEELTRKLLPRRSAVTVAANGWLVSSPLALAALAALVGYLARVLSRPAKDPELSIENVLQTAKYSRPGFQGYDSGERDVDYCGRHFVSRPRPQQVVISKDQIPTLSWIFDPGRFLQPPKIEPSRWVPRPRVG